MAAAQPEEWIAGIVQTPGSPLVVMWYEPETDLVVDIHLTPPGLAAAPELFTRATEQPKAGPPRRPRRVRVADPVLADALRGRIGDVEVVVGDISAAQEALVSLAQHIADQDQHEPPNIALEAWARHFRAAARLYRTKPWNVIPADCWLAVDCEQLGIADGALTVVGQAGESLGFMLCRTVDDALAWLDAGERRERGEPASLPLCYMFSFDHESEINQGDLAEIAEQRWELAGPAAVPRLTVIEGDAESRLPSEAELAGVTAIMEALCSMVEDEPDLADAWEGEQVEYEAEIDGRRVWLAAPLDLPPPAVNPADASLDILGADGLIDELQFDRYRSALMTRLAARDEIPDEVLAAAEMLVEFAAQYHRASFARIDVDGLATLLLETIPAQLAVEPDEAARIVAAARELVRLAGDELGNEHAGAALAQLDESFERRLAAELANADNFGVGKQLVMQGIAAGFDMSTEEGVAEFVETFAAEARAEGRAKSKAKTASKSTSAVKAKATPAAKAKAKGAAKAPAKPAAKATSKAKAKPAAKATSKAKSKPAGKATSKPAGKAKSKPAGKAKAAAKSTPATTSRRGR